MVRAYPSLGLSPPVRGNQSGKARPHHASGSIPACAGEPHRPTRRRKRKAVYPRLCGGTGRIKGASTKKQGLSPPVRGNHIGGIIRIRSRRSIPACAGEPPPYGRDSSVIGVYPRLCGGTLRPELLQVADVGLSPPVRGNRPGVRPNHPKSRSIPACAGEPGKASPRPGPPAVYPRLCGGTGPWPRAALAGLGLSPPVRGNHPEAVRNSASKGSIPACAGEPRGSARKPRKGPVYPRLCGGTALRRHPSIILLGLSPPVRGNLPALHFRPRSRRSIPACAGEPNNTPPPDPR